MGQRVPSVNVNEIQGDPFPPDVNFRGFSASPLLGTPQDVYAVGTWFNENGWRDYSPSTVGERFAKVDKHSQTCELDLAGRW
jgi:hypothetical protein